MSRCCWSERRNLKQKEEKTDEWSCDAVNHSWRSRKKKNRWIYETYEWMGSGSGEGEAGWRKRVTTFAEKDRNVILPRISDQSCYCKAERKADVLTYWPRISVGQQIGVIGQQIKPLVNGASFTNESDLLANRWSIHKNQIQSTCYQEKEKIKIPAVI